MWVSAFYLPCSWLDSCQPWKWTPSHQPHFPSSWQLSCTLISLTMWRNFSFSSLLLYLLTWKIYFLLERKDHFVTLSGLIPDEKLKLPEILFAVLCGYDHCSLRALKRENPHSRKNLGSRMGLTIIESFSVGSPPHGATPRCLTRAEPQRLLARQIEK